MAKRGQKQAPEPATELERLLSESTLWSLSKSGGVRPIEDQKKKGGGEKEGEKRNQRFSSAPGGTASSPKTGEGQGKGKKCSTVCRSALSLQKVAPNNRRKKPGKIAWAGLERRGTKSRAH